MKKKIWAILLSVVMTISIAVAAFAAETDNLTTSIVTSKEDNPISVWAVDSIRNAYEEKIIETTRDYVYGEPITREEFCELIYNLIHITIVDKGVEVEYLLPNEIIDTKNAKVLELYAREIINGKSRTEFAPNDFLTREEAAVIIGRTIEKSIPIPMHGLYYEFKDASDISDWAMDGVQAVCNMGVMKGTGDNRFSPKGTFKVEEAITTLMRVFSTYNSNKELIQIKILIEDKTVNITNSKDVNTIKNIFLGVKYDRQICKGMVTHEFKIGKDIYYLLSSCKEIRMGDKQALISDENLSAIEKIIESANTTEFLSFADRLNEKMPDDKNYMFSPLSIKMALLMAANGAEGETQKEILDAIGVNDLPLYNNAVKKFLATYSQSELLKLSVANSIWLNKDQTEQRFSKDYEKKIADIFDATSDIVDNKNATKEINGWVNEKTNGKIPTIINEDNKDFWAMLINAVYFKGRWQNEFSKSATKEDVFTDKNGKENKIDFMNKTSWLQYANENDMIIVELPYLTREDKVSKDGEYLDTNKLDGIDISMYLMMADKEFNPERVLQQAQMERGYIRLSVPKFNVEYGAELSEMLKSLGVKKAFEKDAEFEPMFDKDNMWIDSAIHKTYIKVDEEGTEAAAVTALGMAGSSLPPEPITVKYNKPFTFVIEDNINGEILFMGEYAFAN